MTDWPGYIQQMAPLLRPRGYIEVHDYAKTWYKAGSDQPISLGWEWQQAMRGGAAELGLDLDIGLHARKYMEDVGLVDVQVVEYKVPFGTWMVGEKPETRRIGEDSAKDLGPLFSNNALPGITRNLEIGEKEMEELKEECRRCMAGEDGKYWTFYVTTGRKV